MAERYTPPRFIYDEHGRRVPYFRRFRKGEGRRPLYFKRGLDARNRILVANRGLIGHVIQPFAFASPDEYDDAFQHGAMGMIRAIEKYRPRKGKLSTYAGPWILQFVRRWREHKMLVWVPHYLRSKRKDLPKHQLRLAHARTAMAEIATLGRENGNEIYDGALERLEPDLLAEREVIELVESTLRRLPAKERRVLLCRFFKGHTLKQAGEEIGVCRERIRQIERDALDRIRLHLSKCPRLRRSLEDALSA